jgi:hypothetical protein
MKTRVVRVIVAAGLVVIMVLAGLGIGNRILASWRLRSMRVLGWEEDRYLWMAGPGGVLRWDVSQQTITDQDSGLDGVEHFLVATEHHIWAYGGQFGSLWLALFDAGKWVEMDETWGLAAKPLDLLNASSGDIWAATLSGFHSWNQENQRWELTEIDQPGRTLAEGPDGTLWFGLDKHGIIRLESDTLTQWTTADGLADNGIRSLLVSRNGSVWAGTAGGVSHWDGVTWEKWEHLGYPDPDGLSVYKLYEMTNGTIWAATSQDMAKWDGKRWMTYEGAPFCGTIFTLLEARDGSLWIGCANGVFRWTGSGFQEYGESEGIEDNSMGRLVQSKNGTLYAISKSGTYQYSPTHDNWGIFPETR